MDLYHIWCNLKPDVSDLEFCESANAYLDRLRELGRIEGFRITRRKLGLGPSDLGEFHIMIEVKDLAQLDAAFREASAREGEVEMLHAAVNQRARDVRFALYRDFPDAHRKSGDEQF